MKFKTKINLFKYIYLIISLLGVFLLMSLYDLIMTSSISDSPNIGAVILYHFLNDFWTVIIIGLLFTPFYVLLVLLSKKLAITFFKLLFLILVIAQFSLIKYSLTTRVNLGTDLLGYSIDDIKMTISSSESFSWFYFLPFIILPVLFFGFNYLLNRKHNTKKVAFAFVSLIFIFGTLKLIQPEASSVKYQNKMYFLFADIVKLEKERIQNKYLLLAKRNDYPLLRPQSDIKDVLTPFFNIKKDKPTIVMLIIEGLGSEFVGEYEYAGFTPYLDSLIDKSLYWNNFLSTTSRSF